MLASAFLLLLNGAFLSLRLGAGSGSFPRPLPAKEERRCVERWMQGDLEARNTLIEHNLRLVAHIIKKYYTSESEQDDLISIGTVGLIKGVSTYRPDKGVRLATYASRCIENEVLMHFRGSRKSAGDLSLSDSIDTDSDGNSLSLIDVLADEEDMSERVVQTDLCQHLSQLIDNVLDEREAEILRLRYGLNGDAALTQRETARRCGISRSYVSRREKKALENLKRKLEEESYEHAKNDRDHSHGPSADTLRGADGSAFQRSQGVRRRSAPGVHGNARTDRNAGCYPGAERYAGTYGDAGADRYARADAGPGLPCRPRRGARSARAAGH